jgi:hypothetical protein
MASDKIKNSYNPKPQGDSSPTPSSRQPPQGSQRRSHKLEHLPEERETPERQGSPAPGSTANPSAQGAAGRPSGTESDRNQEEATSGEPRGTHTRTGRQKTPGKRS